MKRHLNDLAIFGGRPAFIEPLHVGRPTIGDRARLMERITGALDRRWLTNHGPLVKELEQRVSQLTDTEHCIAVANGTLGLQLVARALKLDGEVIMPAFTFVATPHAFEWLGLRPVFCDVDPQTHVIDPRTIEARISPRTSAIVGVHLWGRACDVDQLTEIAARHGLKLIFDAAHAFGCARRGRSVGGFGDVEVFSLHATKIAHAFEGGMLTTNDGALATRLRAMRDFGFVDYDTIDGLGINGKMNEVCAAMGLTSLDQLEDVIASNRLAHDRYREELQTTPRVRLYAYDAQDRNNYQYVVVEVNGQVLRDDIHRVLWADNVRARRYFYPGCHRVEPYAGRDPEASKMLPVTDRLVGRLLCLPTGPNVTESDIREVCGIVRLVVEHESTVRSELRRSMNASV